MDREDRLDQIDCLGVLEGCSHDPLDLQSLVELGACRRRQNQDCQKDPLGPDPEDRGLFRRYCRSPGVAHLEDEAACSNRKGLRSLEEAFLRREREDEVEKEDRGRGEGERVVGDRHAEGFHEQGQAVGQM